MKLENNLILSNGFKIPSIGFGCGAVKQEDIENVITTALDAGYRLFDCALLYGNECSIGDAFEKIFAQGKYYREDVFITTKLPMIGNHPARVEKFIQRSLENLKLSYIDLYLIHFPVGFIYREDGDFFPKMDGIIQFDFETNLVELWKAMEAQVHAKRTKSIGLSNFNKTQILKIMKSCTIPPVNLQIEVHVYFQQKELRSFCEKHDIIVSAYAPLGSPGRNELFKPNGIPGILDDPIVLKIAKKHGKLASQILLRFLLQNNVIALPKSSTDERIRRNIDIFDIYLETEDIIELENLDKGKLGRSFDYPKIFKGLEGHPENPMAETLAI